MKSETEGQRARRLLRALIIDDIFNIDIQQAAALGCTNLHVHCAAAECGVCSKRCRSVGVCVCISPGRRVSQKRGETDDVDC